MCKAFKGHVKQRDLGLTSMSDENRHGALPDNVSDGQSFVVLRQSYRSCDHHSPVSNLGTGICRTNPSVTSAFTVWLKKERERERAWT